MIDVHSLGAGGGSIARLTASGSLQGVCFFRNDAELEKNQRIMAHCT
jgi:N-methylhydantoinase A/oxoprolinase/acetone carboxylase beta subunit